MLAILRLKDDAYGISFIEEVQKRTGKELFLTAIMKKLIGSTRLASRLCGFESLNQAKVSLW